MGTLTSVSGYRFQRSRLPNSYAGVAPVASDGQSLSFFDASRDDNRKTYQQELRFASKLEGPFQFVAGAFLQHESIDFCVAQYLGFLDLTAVMFLTTSSNRPVHLFGRVGIAFALAGVLVTMFYTWPWFLGEGLRLRPGLLFGLVLVILGIQFLSLGFLGEMIAGSRAEEPHYAIRERV